MHTLSTSPSEGSLPFSAIEGALILMSIGVSIAWPKLGSAWFAQIERVLARLTGRKSLAVFVVGLSAVILRLAILPRFPIPLPFIPDDFSFLLAADTFSHGRLTNPTPAMWVHFESLHIEMLPTYMSMYFPGPALALAIGTVLFGH